MLEKVFNEVTDGDEEFKPLVDGTIAHVKLFSLDKVLK